MDRTYAFCYGQTYNLTVQCGGGGGGDGNGGV